MWPLMAQCVKQTKAESGIMQVRIGGEVLVTVRAEFSSTSLRGS